MPRRNGSRAAMLETALIDLYRAPKASKVLSDAAHKAGFPDDDGALIAVALPKLDGVTAQYVAPQIDGKGKPTVEGATLGSKTWRSAWFSLTVNAYRRDGDGPANAIAMANTVQGEPFVTHKGVTYLCVTSGCVTEAKRSK